MNRNRYEKKRYGKNVRVQTLGIDIQSKSSPISPVPEKSIVGGMALTGFVDVEKLIHLKEKKKVDCPDKSKPKSFFLEKRLPFHVLLLELDSLKSKTRKLDEKSKTRKLDEGGGRE